MSNATHSTVIAGIPAGNHTFQVQVRGDTARNGAWNGTVTECLTGWNQDGAYLSVEEFR
jgi:hypothetical protein